MAKQYDNTNSGVIFKNDRKNKDSHPDYNGSVNVEGTDYWISLWVKEGQKGKFFSASLTPKEEQQKKPQPKQQPKSNSNKQGQGDFDDLDSDIPF